MMRDPATDEAAREFEDEQGRYAEAFETSILTTAADHATRENSLSPEIAGAIWASGALGLFAQWRKQSAAKAVTHVAEVAEANDEAWAQAQYERAGMEPVSWDENIRSAAIVKAQQEAAERAWAEIEWQQVVARLADGTTVPVAQTVENLIRSAPATAGTAERAEYVARQLSTPGAVRIQNLTNGRSYEISGWARRMTWQQHNDAIRAMREELGNELGMDAIEISAHMACAPDHLPYQGRIFTRAEYARIQEYLERPIMGWGCRHHVWPCWSDSTPANSAEELAAYAENSTELVDIDGKQMTRYDATQWLRSTERNVRELKTRAKVCDQAYGKGSSQGLTLRRRARELTQKYRYNASLAGLPTDPSRLVVQELKI